MIALARALRCVNCNIGFELTPGPVATTGCPHCGSEHVLPIDGWPAKKTLDNVVPMRYSAAA